MTYNRKLQQNKTQIISKEALIQKLFTDNNRIKKKICYNYEYNYNYK